MTRKAAGGATNETAETSSQIAAASTSALAIAAAFAAFFSIVCPPFGVVAILIGTAALRRLRASGDVVEGQALARTAVAVGSATSFVTLLALSWLWATDNDVPLATASPVTTTRQALAPRDPLLSAPAIAPLLRADAGRESVHERRVAGIVVVDIDPTIFSLARTLEDQHAIATGSGRRLMLWVVAPECKPCDDVTRTLEHPRMQRALAKVRLLRLSVAHFVTELSHLSIPIDAFPGFALIGEDTQVVDYVNGSEWDEDVPGNIAPVLESFAAGSYHQRRHPWRGGPRDDETSI